MNILPEDIAAPALKMVKNERMAGFVPSYELSASGKGEEASFGFLDFVDMINPLQHIPVVNTLYRKITGDEIKPISMIMGGAVFGGPLGAGAGVINAVMKDGTGKDVMGNVESLAFRERPVSYSYDMDKAAYEDLPVALLSFAQMPIVSKA